MCRVCIVSTQISLLISFTLRAPCSALFLEGTPGFHSTACYASRLGPSEIRPRPRPRQPAGGASSSARTRTMRPGLVNFASVTGPRVTLIVAFTRTCFCFTGAGSSPGGLLDCNLSLLPILLVLSFIFLERAGLSSKIPSLSVSSRVKAGALSQGLYGLLPVFLLGPYATAFQRSQTTCARMRTSPDCPPDCHCSACSLLSKDATSHVF